jgi:hypothetical protein
MTTRFLRGRAEAMKSRDESGAILVLALIFMVVTALLITGLTAWEGNDIKNVGSLKSARSAVYAAEAAIQVAAANTRSEYPSSALLSSTGGFCPNDSSQQQQTTNPFTMDGQNVVVWCNASTNLAQCPKVQGLAISDCTRVETLSAYLQSECTSTQCTGQPYVQSEVVFDDYSSQNINDCVAGGLDTTCGGTMSVYSNVVLGGSP